MASLTTKPNFIDLNILHDPRDPQATVAKVRLAIELGYDSVAINIDVGNLTQQTSKVVSDVTDEDGTPPSKRSKKGNSKKVSKTTSSTLVQIPDPYIVPSSALDTSTLAAQGRLFRQYSRLTMCAVESGELYAFFKTGGAAMGAAQVAKYDIVAMRPANEMILQTVAAKLEGVDLITFDAAADDVAWMLRKSNVLQMAAKRGVSFEISYAPALADSSRRRQVISNARELRRATRGRNVVLTSRAERPIELRAPIDAANMCTLFGWTPEEGRRALTTNAHRVLLASATRRTIRSSMHVRTVDEAPPALLERLLKIPEFRGEAESADVEGN